MPKLQHYDNLGTARFVTFCCYRLERHLAEERAIGLVVKHMDLARNKHRFKLLAYVIMPEHVHLVLFPEENMKLGLVIGEIKSMVAREYFALANGDSIRRHLFWQKRCYDHNCRTPESVKEKIVYCHNNPGRRGLVAEPGEYKWSSYNWYRGKRDVLLAMDDYEL